MGQLVNDAKELVNRLKEREKNVDKVVNQSNALAKRVDAIQQVNFWPKFWESFVKNVRNLIILIIIISKKFDNELMNLNEKANHRSKVAVLSSIQKENKVIK